MRESVCVLVSGGLDSDVLLAQLASRYSRVSPVYIRQGLSWEKTELYWLRRFLAALRRPRPPKAGEGPGEGQVKPLQIFSLPMTDVYRAHWSVKGKKVPGAKTPDKAVYLPGRNPVLMVKAAVFCAMNKIPAIAIGSLDHNPFPDAAPAFFRSFSRALGMGLGHRIRIETPYRAMSKVEVIRRGKALPLELSFSCLAPVGKKHCGKCNKCAERRKAFRLAGVKDLTAYASSPAGRGRGLG